MNRKHILLISGSLLLIAALVLGRTLPHAPNFTPVAAIAIFAGFLFRNRILAMAVPVTGMLLTDLLFEGTYQWEVMAAVYAALLVPALLGGWMRKPVQATEDAPKWKKPLIKVVKLFTLAAGSTVLFFFVTNIAVWAFSGMYAQTASGLAICLTSAIPFAKPMLAGDLLFTFGIFGAYFAVEGAIAMMGAKSTQEA